MAMAGAMAGWKAAKWVEIVAKRIERSPILVPLRHFIEVE
jgi:hypothetical protein